MTRTPHDKGQCQFAQCSTETPRCTEAATRKWGDFWFCDFHGSRSRSNNGGQTQPLTPHAWGVLESLAQAPIPSHEVNPGVIDRFNRESLATIREHVSPYKKHKGGTCPHLFITPQGREALKRKP